MHQLSIFNGSKRKCRNNIKLDSEPELTSSNSSSLTAGLETTESSNLSISKTQSSSPRVLILTLPLLTLVHSLPSS